MSLDLSILMDSCANEEFSLLCAKILGSEYYKMKP